MLGVEILDGFQLADGDESDSGLTFWKELIYVGSFHKKTDTESLKFAVSERDIDNWVSTHKLFMSRGIDVPLPKDHSFDVESSRGNVTDMIKKTDSKGRIGLFGKVKFRDEKAAELAKTAKVSIYVPPEYTDAHENTYSHPIRHVALTDYPVVNSLDGFIAASFNEGVKNMPVKKLANALGIKFAEDDDDEKISAAIAAEFATLKKGVKAAMDDESGGGDGDETTTTEEPKPTVSASMRNMLEENRNNKINGLVLAGKITPAVATGLKDQYCTEGTLTLSLTTDKYDDGFGRIMATLDKNDPVVLGEQTAGQTNRQVLKLGKDEVNPLHADADRRNGK